MYERLYHKATLPNNETLHYQEANPQSGMLQAIVLVHGNYSAEYWWDDIIDGLKPLGYRIIAMDLRGYGESTYHTPCNRFKDWAEDVIELCKLLKIEKAIVNGWSFGGTIAQKIAQLAPELVVKLILTASFSHEGLIFLNQAGGKIQKRKEIASLPKVSEILNLMVMKNYRYQIREFFKKTLYLKIQNLPVQKMDKLEEGAVKQKDHLDSFEALANSDIQIEKIKCKTLLIHGNEDLVLPLKTIIETAEKLGKLEVWEEGGHMLPLENTPRYLESVIKFINE